MADCYDSLFSRMEWHTVGAYQVIGDNDDKSS